MAHRRHHGWCQGPSVALLSSSNPRCVHHHMRLACLPSPHCAVHWSIIRPQRIVKPRLVELQQRVWVHGACVFCWCVTGAAAAVLAWSHVNLADEEEGAENECKSKHPCRQRVQQQEPKRVKEKGNRTCCPTQCEPRALPVFHICPSQLPLWPYSSRLPLASVTNWCVGMSLRRHMITQGQNCAFGIVQYRSLGILYWIHSMRR